MTPTTFGISKLMKHDVQRRVEENGATYFVPARPYGLQGLHLWTRLKAAWSVFTGRCDAVDWENGDYSKRV
ncbi:hypothetical protein GR11A_00202 [Vibrio phage vB_VcorM_GR11A]|nr:hypothetical protein GR11A_00202 [Vibrio phage vB_VcorM_GR11A]